MTSISDKLTQILNIKRNLEENLDTSLYKFPSKYYDSDGHITKDFSKYPEIVSYTDKLFTLNIESGTTVFPYGCVYEGNTYQVSSKFDFIDLDADVYGTHYTCDDPNTTINDNGVFVPSDSAKTLTIFSTLDNKNGVFTGKLPIECKTAENINHINLIRGGTSWNANSGVYFENDGNTRVSLNRDQDRGKPCLVDSTSPIQDKGLIYIPKDVEKVEIYFNREPTDGPAKSNTGNSIIYKGLIGNYKMDVGMVVANSDGIVVFDDGWNTSGYIMYNRGWTSVHYSAYKTDQPQYGDLWMTNPYKTNGTNSNFKNEIARDKNMITYLHSSIKFTRFDGSEYYIIDNFDETSNNSLIEDEES